MRWPCSRVCGPRWCKRTRVHGRDFQQKLLETLSEVGRGERPTLASLFLPISSSLQCLPLLRRAGSSKEAGKHSWPVWTPRWWMRQTVFFPFATVAYYLNLSDLKSTNLFCYSFRGWKSKIKVSAEVCFFWRLLGENLFPFPASGRYLHFLAHGAFLHLLSVTF